MAEHPEMIEIIKEPGDKLNFGGGWHSDMSFLEHPSIGSILYALEVPECGGDTLFASQVAAYEALSPGLKATLEGLNAVHSANREYGARGPSAQKRGSMQIAEAEGMAGEYVHPVVKVHPRDRQEGALRQSGLHAEIRGLVDGANPSRCSTTCSPIRAMKASPAASAGRRARSPSGTIAASGISRSTTIPASAATCAG